MLDAGDDASVRSSLPPAARRAGADPVRPRRELVDDFADDADTEAFLRASGRNRRIRRGLLPQSRTGRILAGITALLCIAAVGAGLVIGAKYLTTSPRFRIPSSQSIEVDGNTHLTRAQMLSVFGEDVDRNIFLVPMDQRRTQLEQMPWVEHATVMRLLPNRIRVHVVERVPVAFVRQGGSIGMVDASGVLLDVPPDAPGRYSFPVITGLKAEDTPESRTDRMKLYASFLKDLDSDGKGKSAQLSEVDLSDPEDIKALLPDHNSEVLVHFGTEHFLSRYNKFQDHIAEWRSQYPRLSSVDMRYERQVVLQMPPKDSTVASSPAPGAAPSQPAAEPHAAESHTAVAHAAVAARPAASQKPVVHAAAARLAKPAHDSKEAAQRKRVDAIKAWMAKREKMRAAAAN